MRNIKILFAIFVTLIIADGLVCATSGSTLPIVPLYRYYNEGTGDHFYEINVDEDLNDLGQKDLSYIGYANEGIAGWVFPDPLPDLPFRPEDVGLVPLYRYWNEGAGDHFYEIKDEDLNYIGYISEGIECWVYEPGIDTDEVTRIISNYGYYDVPKIVEFHRYWNEGLGDHFYEKKDEDLSYIGYASEGVECLVHNDRPVEG